MARRDKTGPLGEGPRTGRGLGLCNTANPTNNIRGRGLGCARGHDRGRSCGRGYRMNKDIAAK